MFRSRGLLALSAFALVVVATSAPAAGGADERHRLTGARMSRRFEAGFANHGSDLRHALRSEGVRATGLGSQSV